MVTNLDIAIGCILWFLVHTDLIVGYKVARNGWNEVKEKQERGWECASLVLESYLAQRKMLQAVIRLALLVLCDAILIKALMFFYG